MFMNKRDQELVQKLTSERVCQIFKQLAEWTPSKKNTISKNTIPNERYPEWAQPRMETIPKVDNRK